MSKPNPPRTHLRCNNPLSPEIGRHTTSQAKPNLSNTSSGNIDGLGLAVTSVQQGAAALFEMWPWSKQPKSLNTACPGCDIYIYYIYIVNNSPVDITRSGCSTPLSMPGIVGNWSLIMWHERQVHTPYAGTARTHNHSHTRTAIGSWFR